MYSDFYNTESGGIWHVLTASPFCCCTVVGSAANMMVVEAT